MMKQSPEKDSQNKLALGISLGLCLGTGLGMTLFDNLAAGAGIGLALGVCFGVLAGRRDGGDKGEKTAGRRNEPGRKRKSKGKDEK